MNATPMSRWLAAATLGFSAALAQAQTYPSKPLKFIVPYPPAGIADEFARSLARDLGARLGQPVIVENKPGGSLIIGTDAAAKSPADGYTLLLGSVTSLAINVGAFKKLPYDPIKDFDPISLGFYTPLMLVTSLNVPATNVKELIAHAKANPGKVTFASIGFGSSLHLAGELFKSMAGLDLVHVPYKGTTTAMPDLIAGRVNMIFAGGDTFLPQARAGKVRLLAQTGAKRLESLPETPTLSESVPGYELAIWFGVVSPAGTPKPILARLSREVAAVVNQAEFKAHFLKAGMATEGSTPEAMTDLIRKDTVKWTKLLRDAGVPQE
jgi:tripartite-type tricarboxylate transporter receptor subunit TctC